MNYHALTKTHLFRGTTEQEAQAMLKCIGAYEKKYAKGEVIYLAGDAVENVGLVLNGSVNIENDDVWGNKSILAHIEAGELFAEAYACIPGEPLMVSVVACQKTEVLFLNVKRLMSTCSFACEHHKKLILNLLKIVSSKNLGLSRRMMHTSPKTIRARLLSFFSERATLSGSRSFTIPFNRQQLADYLGVDRSALSNELSKMQAEGKIKYEKNKFRLNDSVKAE